MVAIEQQKLALEEYRIIHESQRSLNNQSIASGVIILASNLGLLGKDNHITQMLLPILCCSMGLLLVYLRSLQLVHYQYLRFLAKMIHVIGLKKWPKINGRDLFVHNDKDKNRIIGLKILCLDSFFIDSIKTTMPFSYNNFEFTQ